MSGAVRAGPLAAGMRTGWPSLAGDRRSPWAVAGAVFLVYGLWLAAMFSRGYDARDSIVLGKNYVQKSHVSAAIKVDPHFAYPVGGSGYDGQFFYYIAVDPVNARYYMDSPSYRYTKILYPVVARVLALGRAGLVPYTLILTNWLAIAGTAWLLAAWLRRKGMSPWFAVVYALCPGVWVSFERDLTEPLSYALVVLAVYLYDSRSRYRFASSGAAFALAILARDKAAIFAGMYGLGLVLRGMEEQIGLAWSSWRDVRRDRVRALPAAEGRIGTEMDSEADSRPMAEEGVGQDDGGALAAIETRRRSAELREPMALGGRYVGQAEELSGRSLRPASSVTGGARSWFVDTIRLAARNVVEAGIFAMLALGPYLLWRLFLRHWLHGASSVSGVTGVSTSYQSTPLTGVLAPGIGTSTRVMYVFVLFVPALICAGMGIWALVRRVWSVEVVLLLVLIELSIVGLGADYFVDVFGVLRVEAGVVLAATLCLPSFGRLTRGNSLWFSASSGGWLLLTAGYMLLAPAWFLSGRA